MVLAPLPPRPRRQARRHAQGLKGNPSLLIADLCMFRSTIALLKEGTLTDDDVGWFALSDCPKQLVTGPEEVDAALARAQRVWQDAAVQGRHRCSVQRDQFACKAAFRRG
ncbi:hypothetical protein ACP4OV_026760 [Aristida adscensionis]